MIEFDFLKDEEIWGDKALSIFYKNEIHDGKLTDFAILLGGYSSFDPKFRYLVRTSRTKDSDNQRLPDIERGYGGYWTASAERYGAVILSYNGRNSNIKQCRFVAARPASLYSEIQHLIQPDAIMLNNYDVPEFTYGEYPQDAVDKEMAIVLNQNENKLQKTGEKFTVDSRKSNEYVESFKPIEYDVYIYNNRRFIKVKANLCQDNYNNILSNGKNVIDGEYVWIEIKPIKWLLDMKSGRFISKKLLFAGIQFGDYTSKGYYGDFEATNIKNFMDNYFSKEIIPKNIKLSNSIENTDNQKKHY